MELIENLLQLLTTFLGALLSGIAWQKSRRQAYFLLLCFYGCFALGSLYWTLYLLLFNTTPRVLCVGVRLGRQRDFSADFAGHADRFGGTRLSLPKSVARPFGRRAAAGVLLHVWGRSLQPDLVRLDDLAVLLRYPGTVLCEHPDRRSAE